METLTMSDTSNCSKCVLHHKLSQKEEEINVSYNHHIVQKESAYLWGSENDLVINENSNIQTL